MKPDPDSMLTFNSALISKDPLPSELDKHLRKLVKEHTQGDVIYTDIPDPDEISEFDQFGSLKIVKEKPGRIKREEGKLWQNIETFAFIGTGTLVAGRFELDLISSLAFSALGFLTGKAAYGVTKGCLKSISKQFSRNAGWVVGGLTSTAAGYWMLRMHPTKPSLTFLQSFAISSITIVAGVATRNVAWAMFKGPKGPTREEVYQNLQITPAAESNPEDLSQIFSE